MHAAKLLAVAMESARRAGFEIREEVLEGAGGGHCLIHGKKWLLLDMTQSHREQLSDVLDALRSEPALDVATIPAELVSHLEEPLRQAA